MHLVRQLTRTNHCHIPRFTNAGSPSDKLPDLFWSISINNNIFLGWLAIIITIEADGETIRLLRKTECTFASWTLSINRFIGRRVLGQIKCELEIRQRTVQGLKLLRWWVPVAVLYMSYIGANFIPQHLRSLPTGNF